MQRDRSTTPCRPRPGQSGLSSLPRPPRPDGVAGTAANSARFPAAAIDRTWKDRFFLILSGARNHTPDERAPMSTRREHDLLGDRDVPAEAYYGVHTLRAVENFPITGTPISVYPDLVAALASIKQAAARSNHELGLLSDAARRHRRRLRGNAGRQAARAVRGGRHPGRRRHLDQHERQRGDRQSRAGTARPSEGRLRIPASERARQPEPEHQRRLSDRAQARGLCRHHATGRRHGGAARVVRGQGRGVQGHPQDGPHAVAGCGADDAGAGVLHLRRHAGRRRAAAEGSGASDLRDQPGRDRDRHRHQRASGLCGAGVPASARRSPAFRW